MPSNGPAQGPAPRMSPPPPPTSTSRTRPIDRTAAPWDASGTFLMWAAIWGSWDESPAPAGRAPEE